MKAILIDAINKEVKEIETNGYLKSIYELIGCDSVDYVLFMNGKDGMYVDDEWPFKANKNDTYPMFKLMGVNQPFAGNAVIIGDDGEGGNCDITEKVENVKNSVKFGRFPFTPQITSMSFN